MSRAALEAPSFFTQEWFTEQKKLGKPDSVIRSELYVCESVFKRWKKELGVRTTVDLRIKNHVKPMLEGKEEIVKNLYLAGATYVMIGKKLHVSKETVRKEIRKLGLRRII